MARADSIDSTNASRLARQQAERSQAIHVVRHLRREAKAEIDRLLNFLDESDPYVTTGLEDDGDDEDTGDSEPSLGALQWLNQTRWSDGYGDDREQDRADDEPSLGALEQHPIQTRGMRAGEQTRDRSGDQSWWAMDGTDDREIDEDFEPSLASPNTEETQANWARGGTDDREVDDSESGIGDRDALLEQVSVHDWTGTTTMG